MKMRRVRVHRKGGRLDSVAARSQDFADQERESMMKQHHHQR